MLQRYALRVATAVVAIALPVVMLSSPASARPDAVGPSQECTQYTYVAGTIIGPNQAAEDSFAWNNTYSINSILNQDANKSASYYMDSFLIQSSSGNYVIVGSRNDSVQTSRSMAGYFGCITAK